MDSPGTEGSWRHTALGTGRDVSSSDFSVTPGVTDVVQDLEGPVTGRYVERPGQ